MSGFYKLDPAAWNCGATALSLEEEAAFLRIINAIHLHDRPLPNDDRTLAGMFRCSTRKARALRDSLIEAGKIRIEGGCILNDRAISELVHRGFVSKSRAETGAKGGRTRAERAAKSVENKEALQAIASSRIEENRREENISSSSSARDAQDAENSVSDSLIPRLTHALGFDLHGQVPKYWITPEAGMIVSRWRTDLGLTDDEIVTVAEGSARAHGSPARGPKVLNDAMCRYAAEKHSPPLTPTDGGMTHAQRHPSRADQRAAAADDATAERIAYLGSSRKSPATDWNFG